ncbi:MULTISPECIES: hypothetical protein [Vibrio]|uniref:hypothetical protein n=1 Tax=Vibrio TaxID=662 RepID=UPI002075A508|nr:MULTISPECIES: hypothetical protein [Vibrio]USD31303.1 hypothetical protein J8Z27_08365 [Vibrio sp. SCSIO 43186]USD44348.1 hypothetical protein J4N38_08755 [Vibrio sp. SCSIO 43145]USD68426.1 hypothetical protein J4N41_08365 [Vibrio sp. SCSIO 43139]USD96112.1 hypothetical protein CTT30_08475 [Vibrio coralliilyticus]
MFIRTALLTVICAFSPLSFAESSEKGITEQIYHSGSNYLSESYDAFSPNNRTFELVLKDQGSDKTVVFQKNEKSDLVRIYATNLNKSHYVTRPISGKIQIRFSQDPDVYDLTTNRHYIRPTLTRLSKERDAKLFASLKSRKVMFVKLDVLGKEHVLKINIDNLEELLIMGTFI